MNNAVMKFDFEQPDDTKTFELNDGEFTTEQVFVPNGGPKEDDGWVVVQTIDGKAKKANVVVLDGTTMELLYRGQAPELALQGIHSEFFSFDQGCSIEGGCIPNNEGTTTEGTTTEGTTTEGTNTSQEPEPTTPNLATSFSFSNTLFPFHCIALLLRRMLN